MYFPALDNLIRLLSSLPGIGSRSARRIAYYILRADEYQTEQLSHAILTLRKEIRFCSRCGGLTDSELCTICNNSDRNTDVICVVEEPGDIYAVENTGEFNGTYHVLNGALSPLDGVGPEELRIQELLDRTAQELPGELLIATNPTLEGDATAHYLAELFQGKDIRLTRISHGIPTGSQLEFADSSALARSIRGRQDL